MDFKVRCINGEGKGFTVGKIYDVVGGRITTNSGTKSDNTYNSVEDLNRFFLSQFELVPDRPRICEVLGSGKPLELLEPFGFRNVDGYFIDSYYCTDKYYVFGKDGSEISSKLMADMIQNSDKIIRRPQFSEDEKALMRLFGESGYWGWYRDSNGLLHAKEFDEMYGPQVPNLFLKSITKDYTAHKPFNAAEYLESEAQK